MLQLVIFAGNGQQRRAAPSTVCAAAALVAVACGPGPSGLASAVVRAGMRAYSLRAFACDGGIPPKAASTRRQRFGGTKAFIRLVVGLVFRTKRKENINL